MYNIGDVHADPAALVNLTIAWFGKQADDNRQCLAFIRLMLESVVMDVVSVKRGIEDLHPACEAAVMFHLGYDVSVC